MITINNIPLHVVSHPQHFLKFSATRISNDRGTSDSGKFQIHSSIRLFHVLAVKQPDGSFLGNYHGGPQQKQRLLNEKFTRISFLCSLYGVGGQTLSCDDGQQLDDGSWLYKGDYSAWSD